MRCPALVLVLVSLGCDPQPVEIPTRYPSEATVLAGVVARVDADASGGVDQEEYLLFHADPATFHSYDADADGVLTPAELRLALQDADPAALRPRKASGVAPPPGTGGPGPGMGGPLAPGFRPPGTTEEAAP